MSYICKLCNYDTGDYSNYNRHKKTKKHIILNGVKSTLVDNNIVQKKQDMLTVSTTKNLVSIKNTNNYYCEKCKVNFKHKSSLSRHKKTCTIIDNNTDLLVKEIQLKLELAEREKELYQKLEKEKSEMLNTFMANANNLLNKSVDNTKVTAEAMKSVSISAIKYANEKFKNTPALLPLDNFNLNDLDFDDEEDKKKLVEILIYNAKQNSLDKLLGDHIVKEYKKENPEEQPFHTTDCSRLNYIVRELMETALIWNTDKSGIKICTSIIKPLIKKCISALLEHQKYLLQEMTKGDYHVQKDVELIINVLMTIESGNLETEINKYIAPYFNLERK